MIVGHNTAATNGGHMRVASHRVAALAVAVSAVVVGCSGDGKTADAPTTQTSAAPSSPIDLWNTQRADQGFDDSASQKALAVLRGLAEAGVDRKSVV